ncbi:hypothetical protein GLGR_3517 [Leminorella grimontii ATCC 33999 = DSM 5078]|nr:hypothetical protein GLGR_3517 [Leminorella grimontii ATCC 33999 = DSM 5078]
MNDILLTLNNKPVIFNNQQGSRDYINKKQIINLNRQKS